jgi:hypothetical protein
MSQKPNETPQDAGTTGLPRPMSEQGRLTGALVAKLHRRKRMGIRHPKVHPETRKVLERALSRLRALDDAPDAPKRDNRLAEISSKHGWLADVEVRPSEEQAWALADSLQALWLGLASGDALRAEATRCGNGALAKLESDDRVRARLRREFESQQSDGAEKRAQSALRARYLRAAGATLVGSVVLTYVVAWSLSSDRGTLTLCALAGMLGGLISSARKLRDAKTMLDLQLFQTWWWVQPAVGAGVGMLLYALLKSPIVSLPGADANDPATQTAALVVYAFLAGFSEPWLLKVLQGIGGAAEDAANANKSDPHVPGSPGGKRDKNAEANDASAEASPDEN